MGKLGKTQGVVAGNWYATSDVNQLKMAANTWVASEPKDRESNRQFMTTFAVYLVKHFRAEEGRLERTHAPGQPWHLREHRRLVRKLRDLLGDMELGLDVTDGIRRLLEAWHVHQESAALRRETRSPMGH